MTRVFSKLSAIAVLVALVASGFVGLTVNAAGTASDTFVYAGIGEPDYLDPAVDWETRGNNIIQNVYETLIWYDGPHADSLVPLLAVELPTIDNGLVSADGLSYTLHIRPGITFHDGTALTADDVTYSIQRVLRIHDMSGPSWMLEQVLTDYASWYVGLTVADYLAESYSAPWIVSVLKPLGRHHVITEEDVQAVAEASVVKVDDMTVIFRLTHPYAGFVSILAAPVSSIVSRDYVEANGGIQNGQQSEYMNTHMCGTGAYKFVSWELGMLVHLARNDAYWGVGPALKDIYVVTANDINTRLLMLEAGDADAIDLPPSYESQVAGNPDIMVVKGSPTFDLIFAAFNFNIDSTTANSMYGSTITDDFFQDIHMRKAFSYLVDYAAVIQMLNGNAIQPNGPIPTGMFGHDDSVPRYSYDFAAAQTELELSVDSGTGNSWWTDGFTIPLFFNTGNVYRQTVMEKLKMAIESLGDRFHANVVGLDWPTYLSQFYNTYSYFPLTMVGWTADYADPDDFATGLLDSVYGTYPLYTGYANPAVDSLLRNAAVELDQATRAQMYSDLSYLVYDDLPYIWLYQTLSFQVMRSWVAGYYYNPMHAGLIFSALSKTVPPEKEIIKEPGSPTKSSLTWTFEPSSSGSWSLIIENNGLSCLNVEIKDVTTGEMAVKLHIALGPYPTGTITSIPVSMQGGHVYSIVVMPSGKTGSSAVLIENYG